MRRYKPQIVVGVLVVIVLLGGAYYSSRASEATPMLVQLVGLVLAFFFGLFEATGLLGRDSLIFNVTDAAWPLSMLWMLVAGITVIRAKRLSGWGASSRCCVRSGC